MISPRTSLLATKVLAGVLASAVLFAAGGCAYVGPDPVNRILSDLLGGPTNVPGWANFTVRLVNNAGLDAQLELHVDGEATNRTILSTAGVPYSDLYLLNCPFIVTLLEVRLYDPTTGALVSTQSFVGVDGYEFRWPGEARCQGTLLVTVTTSSTTPEIVF